MTRNVVLVIFLLVCGCGHNPPVTIIAASPIPELERPILRDIKGMVPLPSGSVITPKGGKPFTAEAKGGAYLPKSALIDYDFNQQELDYYASGLVKQIAAHNKYVTDRVTEIKEQSLPWYRRIFR